MLLLNTSRLNTSGQWVYIFWRGVDHPANSDWVGLFLLPDTSARIDPQNHAPTKFQVCVSCCWIPHTCMKQPIRMLLFTYKHFLGRPLCDTYVYIAVLLLSSTILTHYLSLPVIDCSLITACRCWREQALSHTIRWNE